MAGLSFAAATSMWGRYDPREAMPALREAAHQHMLHEGHPDADLSVVA